MTEKELTPRESMRNLTLSSLERTLIQNTLGANLASDTAKYGTKGTDSAKNAFNNEEIKKAKEEEHEKLKGQYESLGVAGEPTYSSNADISYKVIQGLEHVMEQSYLEDLAEGVNKFIPKLGFELPENLKGYSLMKLKEIITDKKAVDEKTGKLNLEKLSEDEQIALGVYEQLREAYRLTAAEKIMDSNYLVGPKKYLDGVMEKYNPTPKEEKR